MVDYYDSYQKYIYLEDINGNPIEKTPFSNPYDYDSFVIFKHSNFNKENDYAVDSDRLSQWDNNKFKEATRIIRAKYNIEYCTFIFRNRDAISDFMSIYYSKNIIVTAVVQNCNKNNGYPYWTIYYKESDKEEK